MAMNSIAMRLAEVQEETSSYSISRKPRKNEWSQQRPSYNPDLTEITARIGRPSQQTRQSGFFDVDQARSSDFVPVNISDLVKGYKDPAGRRFAPRYDIDLTVVLYTADRSFRTTTRNISAGGALLADVIPESFSQLVFDVLFMVLDPATGAKKYIMVRGQSVGMGSNVNRIRFNATSKQSRESFEKFIAQLEDRKA